MTRHLVCSTCKGEKHEDEYHNRKRGKHGKNTVCKVCSSAYRKKWASYERDKDYNLQQRFGITLSEFSDMMMKQRGLCAICYQPETAIRQGKLQALSVDHDHDTGKVRGLLCNSCNRGIGKLGDNPLRLRRAAEYIEESL